MDKTNGQKSRATVPLKSPQTLVVGCRGLITLKVSSDPEGACSQI